MRSFYRRTTPRVVRGKVQRKNRSARTPTWRDNPALHPVIDRERPGRGYRHLVKKSDVTRFVRLLPNWIELSQGLRLILLARGEETCLGWHRTGIVTVCAWQDCLWEEWQGWFFDEHRRTLDRIGVPYEKHDGDYLCKFEASTVRAFQLVHILVHELGHHHDRMTTRSQVNPSRGERFAERYAQRFEPVIWDRYVAEFGMP